MSDAPIENDEADGEQPSDFDALINVLLPNATEALEEYGHFSPIAAFVQPDGTLCNLAVEFDGEEPDPPEVVELLTSGLKEQVASGDARASAICSIVVARLEEDEPTDAICVTLEQQDGDPLNVFLPFSKSDDGYAYDELVAGHGQPAVFGTA